VPDVNWAVGIRQSGGNCIAFWRTHKAGFLEA